MIDGRTVRILARQVPNYHTVFRNLASRALSVVPCDSCSHSVKKDGHLCCGRVLGRIEDDGIAIVAWNGTCDRAERRTGNAEGIGEVIAPLLLGSES